MPTSKAGILNRGFTLVELTIVLAILAFLFLVLIPRFDFVSDNNLRTASRRLAGTIQSLVLEATATKRVHRLHYSLTKGEYRVTALQEVGLDVMSGGKVVEERPASETISSAKGSLPDGVVFLDVSTFLKGKMTGGEAVTHFYPVGRVEKTVIHLQSSSASSASGGGEQKKVQTLVVDSLTGRVKVYDGYMDVEER